MPKICAFLSAITVFCLAACASYESSGDEASVIVGKLYVIGNEPFTKLAVEMEGGTMYVLQCDKNVEEMLRKHQGEFAKIHFKRIEAVPEGKGVHVVHAEVLSR